MSINGKKGIRISCQPKKIVVKKIIKKDDDIDNNSHISKSINTVGITKKKPHTKEIKYIDSDKTKPVTATGALIYKNVGNKMMILIMDNDGKYEDIGGKIDKEDIDIFSAAAREIEEETNNNIMSSDIVERLKRSPYVYIPKSKYVVFIVEANKNEMTFTKDDFGDYEFHDGFSRTIGWILREDLVKSSIIQFKLNWRLRNKTLFSKLFEIESNFKFKQKLFKQK